MTDKKQDVKKEEVKKEEPKQEVKKELTAEEKATKEIEAVMEKYGVTIQIQNQIKVIKKQ